MFAMASSGQNTKKATGESIKQPTLAITLSGDYNPKRICITLNAKALHCIAPKLQCAAGEKLAAISDIALLELVNCDWRFLHNGISVSALAMESSLNQRGQAIVVILPTGSFEIIHRDYAYQSSTHGNDFEKVAVALSGKFYSVADFRLSRVLI